jgi:hypothetical protein
MSPAGQSLTMGKGCCCVNKHLASIICDLRSTGTPLPLNSCVMTSLLSPTHLELPLEPEESPCLSGHPLNQGLTLLLVTLRGMHT